MIPFLAVIARTYNHACLFHVGPLLLGLGERLFLQGGLTFESYDGYGDAIEKHDEEVCLHVVG